MITCIVPAAGESRRFPWNKLLYVYHERPLIAQTVMNIVESGSIERVVLITGYQATMIKDVVDEIGLSNVEIIYNPDYEKGMSTSVKYGVRYILERGYSFDGIMINPGDVAWIHPGIYSLVVARFYDNLDRYLIAVASYRGRRGHPVIFSSSLTKDLLNITEERLGLKEMFVKYRDAVLNVETNYPGVLLDLDTITDLNRIKQTILK